MDSSSLLMLPRPDISDGSRVLRSVSSPSLTGSANEFSHCSTRLLIRVLSGRFRGDNRCVNGFVIIAYQRVRPARRNTNSVGLLRALSETLGV